MSWALSILVLLAGFLVLMPLLTYLASRRMIGKTIVLDQGKHHSRLLYFYSQSCGPCRRMTPIIDKLASTHDMVEKIDIQQDPDTTRKFGIRATPTTVLVQDNVVKQVALGAKTQQQLEKLLAQIN